MDSTLSRYGHAAALPVGVVLVLAGLILSPARANDRDLRAITIPASACHVSRDYPYASDPLPHGDGFIAQSSATDLTIVSLRCPLPINNIDLSGATDDNDVSKIRVHYRDSDGFGYNASVNVGFYRTRSVATSDGFTTDVVCRWQSDVNGTGASTGAMTSAACPHDISSGAFYYFRVGLVLTKSPSSGLYSVSFVGIDFPP